MKTYCHIVKMVQLMWHPQIIETNWNYIKTNCHIVKMVLVTFLIDWYLNQLKLYENILSYCQNGPTYVTFSNNSYLNHLKLYENKLS